MRWLSLQGSSVVRRSRSKYCERLPQNNSTLRGGNVWPRRCSTGGQNSSENILRADPHYSVFGQGKRPRMDPALEAKWRTLNKASRPDDAETQETEKMRKRIKWAATKRGWVETQATLSLSRAAGCDALSTRPVLRLLVVAPNSATYAWVGNASSIRGSGA